MATGFNQRWKGKVAVPASGIWIAGVQVTPSAADLNVNTGWGTASTISANGSTIPNTGVTFINSTALGIYNLANPVQGLSKVIQIQPGSTGVMIKVSTGVVTIQGGSTTLGASTLTNVISSTVSLVATLMELYGASSVAWVFAGVYPSTLSHLKFSTST
jgi:hypothetical protein